MDPIVAAWLPLLPWGRWLQGTEPRQSTVRALRRLAPMSTSQTPLSPFLLAVTAKYCPREAVAAGLTLVSTVPIKPVTLPLASCRRAVPSWA